MKLLFSEHKSDYSNYIFPYAVWAVPEQAETPAKIFEKGFLPSTRELDLFYLVRQIRIKLQMFQLSSENRRVMRKCQNIQIKLIPIVEFDYNEQWREFCKYYADIKFGKDLMSYSRLDSLFNCEIINHILLFTDSESKKDVGIVTLYLEEKQLAYYYYAFYDLNYYQQNLGMFMMTSAVDFFATNNFVNIYLGTCYSRNALYKTQFTGFQYFNGFTWSDNLKELKYLINRDKFSVDKHLLETDDFVDKFYEGNVDKMVESALFTIII